MQSWLEQARNISSLSIEECARALLQTESEFLIRQSNPGTLTLNEIRVLMQLFNDESKRIVWSALLEFEP